jgi:hypothetical protein
MELGRAEWQPATVAAPKTVAPAKLQARQSNSSGMPADLPAGKTNLIKASYSTGIKPATIARMFRLSQSVVNRVLDLPAKSKSNT